MASRLRVLTFAAAGALVVGAAHEGAVHADDGTPQAPSRLLAGVDVFWGGDSVAEFGLHPALTLRTRRIVLRGSALLPFAYAPGEVIHFDTDHFLHAEGSVMVVLKHFHCLGHSSQVLDSHAVDARTISTTTAYWSESGACGFGPEVGYLYTQATSLSEGQTVSAGDLFVGVRVDMRLGSGLRSYYAHLQHASDFTYPETGPNGAEEHHWGGRMGGTVVVPVSGPWSISGLLEMGIDPSARPVESLPSFRFTFAMGVTHGRI